VFISNVSSPDARARFPDLDVKPESIFVHVFDAAPSWRTMEPCRQELTRFRPLNNELC